MIRLIFTFILLAIYSKSYSQEYKASVIDIDNNPLPYVKIIYHNNSLNTDSTGFIRLKDIKIGDTLVFNDFNYVKKTHVINNISEKIFLEYRYKEIDPVNLKPLNIVDKYEVKKTKRISYLSLSHDIDLGFLIENSSKISFNTIEFPIKYISYKKDKFNQTSEFSVQFYSVLNGLPNKPITEIIYFRPIVNSNKTEIPLRDKIILPKNFFLIIKAYNKNSIVIDNNSYKYNPYFLCNTNGNIGSNIEYKNKEGKWHIVNDAYKVSGNPLIFNAIFKLYTRK